MKLVRNTPGEEVAIQAGIAADPDAPEWTETDFALAVRVGDMTPAQLDDLLPPQAAAKERRRRGLQIAPTKRQISLRVDQDVLDALRGGGPGWQRRANAVLRKGLGLGETRHTR